MAKADIGPKIGIDGEAEFKRQLASINEGLKTTKTEMQAVTSAYINNESSTEALTAENEVLEKSVYGLNEKLALQQKQLEACAKAYGEAAPQTQKMQQAVNKTTAEINTANAKIEQNNQKIQQNGGLLGKLGINLNSVTQKLGLSSSATTKLTSALGSAAAAYAAVGVAVVKLIGNLNELAIKQAAVVDGVNTMAMKYHTSSQAIDAFNYAAKFTDVSTETMLGSLSKLTKNMDSARTGTGAAADAFKALGVAVTDQKGNLRNSQTVFLEVIDSLKGIGNETERDTAAMDIFGKSAMDLNGVIKAGSEGLRGYMEEAAKFGVIISDAANDNLQALKDTKDQVDSIAEAAKTNAAAAWAPVAEILQDIRGGFWLVMNDLATVLGGFVSDEEAATEAALKFAAANDEVKDAISGVTSALDSGKSSRAEYLNEFLNKFDPEQVKRMTEAEKEYLFYLQNLGDYYKSIGVSEMTGYRMSYADFAGKYFPDDPVYKSQYKVDVTLEIDGKTLAQTTIDDFETEANRRGPSAFGGNSTFSANR